MSKNIHIICVKYENLESVLQRSGALMESTKHRITKCKFPLTSPDTRPSARTCRPHSTSVVWIRWIDSLIYLPYPLHLSRADSLEYICFIFWTNHPLLKKISPLSYRKCGAPNYQVRKTIIFRKPHLKSATLVTVSLTDTRCRRGSWWSFCWICRIQYCFNTCILAWGYGLAGNNAYTKFWKSSCFTISSLQVVLITCNAPLRSHALTHIAECLWSSSQYMNDLPLQHIRPYALTHTRTVPLAWEKEYSLENKIKFSQVLPRRSTFM